MGVGAGGVNTPVSRKEATLLSIRLAMSAKAGPNISDLHRTLTMKTWILSHNISKLLKAPAKQGEVQLVAAYSSGTPFTSPLTGMPYQFIAQKWTNWINRFPLGESSISEKEMRRAEKHGKSITAQGREHVIQLCEQLEERNKMWTLSLDPALRSLDPSVVKMAGVDTASLQRTTIRLDMLAEMTQECKERQTREFVLEGIKSGLPIAVGHAPDHLSASARISRAPDCKDPILMQKMSEDVKKEDEMGFVCPAYTAPAAASVAGVSPTFAIYKHLMGKQTEKVRRITHSSAPDKDTGVSVNDLVDDAWARVVYPRFDAFLFMILLAGIGGYIWKFDLAAAYRQLPVRPEDWPFMVFVVWLNGGWRHFLDARLSFGLRSAPRLFCIYASLLLWTLKFFGVTNILNYLDDFVGVAPAASGMGPLLRRLSLAIIRLLGVPTNADKSDNEDLCAGTRVELLGVWVDTVAQTVSLAKERVVELIRRIDAVLEPAAHGGAVRMRLVDAQSLAGLLMHASYVVKQGRPFLRGLYCFFSEAAQALHRDGSTWVNASPFLIVDLKWWRQALATSNAVCFIQRPLRHKWKKAAHPPASDASITAMGGCWNGACWQHIWTEAELKHVGRPDDIQLGEAMAVYKMSFLCKEEWSGTYVFFNCDNESWVRCANIGDAREPRANVVLRALADLALAYNFHVFMVHKPRDLNTHADYLTQHFGPECAAYMQRLGYKMIDLEQRRRQSAHSASFPFPDLCELLSRSGLGSNAEQKQR
jgi:hypothetical protein